MYTRKSSITHAALYAQSAFRLLLDETWPWPAGAPDVEFSVVDVPAEDDFLEHTFLKLEERYLLDRMDECAEIFYTADIVASLEFTCFYNIADSGHVPLTATTKSKTTVCSREVPIGVVYLLSRGEFSENAPLSYSGNGIYTESISVRLGKVKKYVF